MLHTKCGIRAISYIGRHLKCISVYLVNTLFNKWMKMNEVEEITHTICLLCPWRTILLNLLCCSYCIGTGFTAQKSHTELKWYVFIAFLPLHLILRSQNIDTRGIHISHILYYMSQLYTPNPFSTQNPECDYTVHSNNFWEKNSSIITCFE